MYLNPTYARLIGKQKDDKVSIKIDKRKHQDTSLKVLLFDTNHLNT